MRDHYLYLLCSLTLTYLFALQSLDYVHFITDSSTYLNTLRLLLNCTAGSAISKINEQFSYSRTPLALNQCSALAKDQRPLCGFHFQIQSGLHTCTIALLLALFYIFAVSVCIEVLCTALLYTASLCTVLLCTTSLCTALLCTLDSVHCVWCL